jgi:hypothetical protein
MNRDRTGSALQPRRNCLESAKGPVRNVARAWLGALPEAGPVNGQIEIWGGEWLDVRSRRAPTPAILDGKHGCCMAGKAEAFSHFGVSAKNDRWSWSARSADGKTVVVTFWKDRFDYKTNPVSYSTFGLDTLPDWIDSLGNRERIENLKWARANCDGILRVVITEAIDVRASPRQIANAYPQERLLMKLVALNEATGEFSAVNVGT